MDKTFLQNRITVTEAMIVAYEDAITALVAGGMTMSYTLDTGQDRQVVTRNDIGGLQKQLDALYNRLSTMCVRLKGGGSVTARPAW